MAFDQLKLAGIDAGFDPRRAHHSGKIRNAAEPHRSKPQKNPEKNIGSNHILILGEGNFLIMKTAKTKKAFVMVLSVAIFASIFFLNATEVSALSCAFPKSIFIAAYERGTFVDGFVVEHRGTGNWCDTRPIVSERSENLQSTFSIASQNLNQAISSGVYQLETRCRADRWDEWCAKDTTLKQLSANSAELARYKSEWQTKESEALRDVFTKKWATALIIVVIAFLAIFWPWILLRLKKNITRVASLFTFAIILQVIIAFFLFGSFYWSFALWQSLATISSLALLASVVVEVGYLIYRKIKTRRVSSS